MRPTVVAPLVAAALATFAFACSTLGEDEDEDTGALVGGEPSGPEDDAVMLIAKDGKPLCTATLVAPNVLVTARHCVGTKDSATGIHAYQPAELTVHLGAAPTEKAQAVVTKIFEPKVTVPGTTPAALPDGGQNPATPASIPDAGLDGSPQARAQAIANAAERFLEGADIAALLVQPLDPKFDAIVPRKLRTAGVTAAEKVGVVGWNVNGQPMAKIQGLARLKRSGVGVLADATQQTQVAAPNAEGIVTTNKIREFVTEAVACNGDDGAPAFDAQGALIGVTAGVVGPCAQGSLSIFTDVTSHNRFLQEVVASVQTLACATDAKCGGPTAGKICDYASRSCIAGCRNGSVSCGGTKCNLANDLPGAAGTCSTTPATGTPDSGVVEPPPTDLDAGSTTPPSGGDPDASPATSGCTDTSCGGTTASPKVCDKKTNTCVGGCRVGAPVSMCGVGEDCVAGTTDPEIGECKSAPPTSAPPPASNLAPPARPSESLGDQHANDPSMIPETPDGGKGKKAKEEKKGCSVSEPGTKSPADAAALVFAFGAIAAMTRRRRRS